MKQKPRSRGMACPIPTLRIPCNAFHASLAIHIAVVYDGRTARLENAMVQQSRRIPLSPEARQAIERQLAAFREKFGRDPNDDDPILFDPDADDPVPLSDDKYERMMIEAMAEVGISQAMIFAFKRTGRIVTERNKHLLTAEELREWTRLLEDCGLTVFRLEELSPSEVDLETTKKPIGKSGGWQSNRRAG